MKLHTLTVIFKNSAALAYFSFFLSDLLEVSVHALWRWLQYLYPWVRNSFMAINFRRLHAHGSRVIAFSFLYDTECWTHIIVEHMFRFKITGKVKSFSCLLWWYLLHCWNFCNQTWYDDAASVCYSHFEVTVRAQAIKYSCFCHIYWLIILRLTLIGCTPL